MSCIVADISQEVQEIFQDFQDCSGQCIARRWQGFKPRQQGPLCQS